MRLLFLTLIAGLVSACVPHYYVKTDTLRLPQKFAKGSGLTEKARGEEEDSKWWQTFNDRDLENLIDLALQSNLDLEAALARFDQAQAIARQTGAMYWPQIDFNFSGGRSQSISSYNQASSIRNRYDLSVAAAYEIDLWSKYRSQRSGALADVQASENEFASLAMSVAAQVTDNWYLLIEQRSQHQLLEQQTKTNETMLKLVQARFEQGLASALDIFQQRQQLIRTRRRLKPTEAQIIVLQNQIAILLGKTPGHPLPSGSSKLPTLTELPSLGVPADLLLRRPDVRAARARVNAADHRVASALADQFPSLRLSASTGLQSENLEDLVDGFIWNIVGGLLMPIVDGGRRGAEVDKRKAELRQAVAQYKKAVLISLQEVENALGRINKQSAELNELELELNVAQSTFNEAQNRYVQGLSDYLPVLNALRSLQEAERAQLSAKRLLISQRIQLHRALGGGIGAKKSTGTPS